MKLLPITATLALALSACSGIGLKQTLESEADELRRVRAELDASWSEVEGRVASIERDVEAFGPDAADLEGVNTEALREDILDATDAEVTEDGEFEGETVDVEGIYEGADAERRAEVEAMRAEAKRIMTELRVGIPVAIGGVAEEAAGAAVEAARIKAEADQKDRIGVNNPLMSSRDQSEARRNRAAIERESDALIGFADQVARESGELSGRLADALASFEAKVAGIGQE